MTKQCLGHRAFMLAQRAVGAFAKVNLQMAEHVVRAFNDLSARVGEVPPVDQPWTMRLQLTEEVTVQVAPGDRLAVTCLRGGQLRYLPAVGEKPAAPAETQLTGNPLTLAPEEEQVFPRSKLYKYMEPKLCVECHKPLPPEIAAIANCHGDCGLYQKEK